MCDMRLAPPSWANTNEEGSGGPGMSHKRVRRFEKVWYKTKRNEEKRERKREKAFEPKQLKAAYQFIPGNAVGGSQGT